MEIPDTLFYTSNHEWIRIEGDEGTIGITDYAQDQLGDIVYVELPEPGSTIVRGESFGVIESVKAVSDLFAPVSGEISERNAAAAEAPEIVNQSPYDAGWLIKVRLADSGEVGDLLDAAAYRSETAGE